MSVLLISFFALLLIGVPVAAVMGISSMLYLLTKELISSQFRNACLLALILLL